MSDLWLRRAAWGTAIIAVTILIVSSILLFLAPDYSSANWLANQGQGILAVGAPILGLVITVKQPRNRIGWLWIVYGLLVGFRALGHAIYYVSGSQSSGYSDLEYFLLWLTEPTNVAVLICVILLMIWFPGGQLPSRRWRFIILWLMLAAGALFLSAFEPGSNWNGGEEAGGIIIVNPYGWLPANTTYYLGLPAFLSIVLIMILAAASLILRYRTAGQLLRLQLRWFVTGGIIFIILLFLPVFLIESNEISGVFDYILFLIGQAAMIPLYLAVGIAILRYQLFDIDLIIRRTLQYSLLTGLLGLIYYGSVVILQSIFGAISGEQSAMAIVISTLIIAALFNPLRKRVQDFIDRRLYRKKYDAEITLSYFASYSRDEVDLEKLAVKLLNVVDETVQPEKTNLWLKQ